MSPRLPHVSKIPSARHLLKYGSPRSMDQRADARRVIEREIGIECDHPDQVCSQSCANQKPVHDAEQGKEQDKIGQETAPNDELGVPPKIQQRIRTTAVGFLVPLAQVLLRTPTRHLVTLESCHKKAGHRTKKQHAAPCQVASIA